MYLQSSCPAPWPTSVGSEGHGGQAFSLDGTAFGEPQEVVDTRTKSEAGRTLHRLGPWSAQHPSWVMTTGAEHLQEVGGGGLLQPELQRDGVLSCRKPHRSAACPSWMSPLVLMTTAALRRVSGCLCPALSAGRPVDWAVPGLSREVREREQKGPV